MRLDKSAGLLEGEPGLEDSGSGVAVDPARSRTWLHYTSSAALKAQGSIRRPVDLKNFQCMRDMLLDGRTGNVWVTGLDRLARLREENERWKTDKWSVR